MVCNLNLFLFIVQPRFTKKLGEFDYVEFGKQIAIQCCSEGVDDINWYRLEKGHWKSFPHIQPGKSNAPRLEEDKQVLRIFDAEFKDNTTFKCELEPSPSGQGQQNGIVQEHQLQLFVVGKYTVKFLNFRTSEIFAVNYLKLRKRDQTSGYFVKKIQMK